jgi:Asp/Glu/hydantoin racemase
MSTLGLLHTVRRVIPAFSDLAAELAPEARQLHFLDESTLPDIIGEGSLTPAIAARVRTLIELARHRCDVVLVTCSSIGPVAEAVVGGAVPVLRVDLPMADEAVARGRRIGVVATLNSTLGPTSDLLERRAAAAGREVEIRRRLCEGAFEAAGRGCPEEHDRLVLATLRELLAPPEPVEVIVLAQASMAAVAAQLPEASVVPVLSSPRSGVAYAAAVLGQGSGD